MTHSFRIVPMSLLLTRCGSSLTRCCPFSHLGNYLTQLLSHTPSASLSLLPAWSGCPFAHEQVGQLLTPHLLTCSPGGNSEITRMGPRGRYLPMYMYTYMYSYI